MERFFEWLSSLEQTEIIRFAVLLGCVMLIIPYVDILYKILRKLIFWQRLHVVEFGYTFYPYDQKVDGSNSFALEGGKVLLHWNVKGALSVRLNQGIGLVQGNAAEVLVSRNRRHFILEAKGVFSRQKAELAIPQEKIRVLDIENISDKSIHSEVAAIQVAAVTRSALYKIPFNLFNKKQGAITKLPMHVTSSLDYDLSESLKAERWKRDYIIQKHACLKSYTFSTRKYNTLH